MTDESGFWCTNVACGGRKAPTEEGICETCQDYYVSDSFKCRPRVCEEERAIVLPNGSCSNCPDHSVVSVDGRECISSACDDFQVTLDDGTCDECPDYTVVSASGKECVSPSCNSR